MDAPGAAELCGELAELGAHVRVVACDLTENTAVRRLVSSIPDLQGIVHAAGALDDGVLGSQTPERVDRVLRPKADVAWALHSLTADRELRLFVLFSSIATALGNPGQANYAAANAFLEALAARRHADGQAALALSWGLWEGREGLLADLTESDRARMTRGGLVPITAPDGLAMFDAACALGEPVLTPARFDRAILRTLAADNELPTVLSDLAPRPPRRAARGDSTDQAPDLRAELARQPATVQWEMLRGLIRTQVAEVLAHPDPDAIDQRENLADLGFDSLIALQLRNRLNMATGLRLPTMLAFEYPTVAAIAERLHTDLIAPAERQEPA
jgi:aryl carrier-like protein